ncbi:hypothetical protein [Clostridium tarantellae]|uniref:hypothetical protein n=1 Tax=Clostridium tarantellae TaxID=39493 RepID=UPI001478D5D0|nr:hypothetical protein [Clostridium tarantellae]
MELIKIFILKCTKLGNTFGFGFWEGLIIYSTIFFMILIKFIDFFDKQRKKKNK